MPDEAVILVDPGSRRPAANAALGRVAEMAARRLGVAVFPAHMVLAEPTLSQAFGQAVAAGARRVVVCPYFLGDGQHSGADIPDMVAEAARQHPKVDVSLSEPLGVDELLAQLIAKRVGPCLRRREDR